MLTGIQSRQFVYNAIQVQIKKNLEFSQGPIIFSTMFLAIICHKNTFVLRFSNTVERITSLLHSKK